MSMMRSTLPILVSSCTLSLSINPAAENNMPNTMSYSACDSEMFFTS